MSKRKDLWYSIDVYLLPLIRIKFKLVNSFGVLGWFDINLLESSTCCVTVSFISFQRVFCLVYMSSKLIDNYIKNFICGINFKI